MDNPSSQNNLNVVCDNYADLYHLPSTVSPKHYDIFLCPDLENKTFFGDIKITIDVSEVISEIFLNSHELTVESARVYSDLESSNKVVHPITTVFIQPKSELIILKMAEDLFPGIYSILITYSGSLGHDNIGFYRSTTNNCGETPKYCALTYFEPTFARYAFPCFDEPKLKAKFKVALAKPSSDEYIALSNGMFEKEIVDYPKKGVTTVYFTETEVMSTYIVCFIVGIFARLEPATAANVTISVYSRPQFVEQTVFARDLAASIVEFFSKYFLIGYPLPKLDLIGIPDAMISGMENWGLVNFQESCLLIEPCDSTSDDFLTVVTLVAHELCHMWFGNLVTMSWWSDLWLKEGMADFMSFLAGNHAFKSWYQEWVFLKYQSLPVLVKDSALSSHPIVQPVSHPCEIREIFDFISYRKGSCLMRMIHNLGPMEFQTGLRKFLQKYQFGVASTEELISCLEPLYDWDVMEVMNGWTSQTGYPLLTVAKSNRLEITQSRFVLDRSTVLTPEQKFRWDIPIKYILSKDPKEVKTLWFHKDQPSVSLELADVKWVKLNWHQVGYYRVNYPLDFWNEFSNTLIKDTQALDSEDRCNLVSDSFHLAGAGLLTYNIPLTLILYLKNGAEDSFLVWFVVFSNFVRLKGLLKGTDTAVHLQTYIQTIMGHVLSELEWDVSEDVPFLVRKLRVELIRSACYLGFDSVLDRVRSQFETYVKSTIPCKPCSEMRDIQYQFGLSGENSAQLWEMVLQRYLQENNFKEVENLLRVLASSTSPDLLSRLLKEAKNPVTVRSQHFFRILRYMIDNPVGIPVVWNFIRSEWGYLVSRFGLNNHHLGLIINRVTTYFSTKKELTEVQDFFNKYPEAGATAAERKFTLENINCNIKWRENNHMFIHNWLSFFVSQLD